MTTSSTLNQSTQRSGCCLFPHLFFPRELTFTILELSTLVSCCCPKLLAFQKNNFRLIIFWPCITTSPWNPHYLKFGLIGISFLWSFCFLFLSFLHLQLNLYLSALISLYSNISLDVILKSIFLFLGKCSQLFLSWGDRKTPYFWISIEIFSHE